MGCLGGGGGAPVLINRPYVKNGRRRTLKLKGTLPEVPFLVGFSLILLCRGNGIM